MWNILRLIKYTFLITLWHISIIFWSDIHPSFKKWFHYSFPGLCLTFFPSDRETSRSTNVDFYFFLHIHMACKVVCHILTADWFYWFIQRCCWFLGKVQWLQTDRVWSFEFVLWFWIRCTWWKKIELDCFSISRWTVRNAFERVMPLHSEVCRKVGVRAVLSFGVSILVLFLSRFLAPSSSNDVTSF